MFKSYVKISHGKIVASYKIIDTDFEDDPWGIEGKHYDDHLAAAVIRSYESRGLPVVPNLVRAFMSMRETSNNQPWARNNQPAWVIKFSKAHCPEYLRYADEVDKEIAKYLVLLP